MICKDCNVVIPDGMRFCPMCGADVRAAYEAKQAVKAECAQEEPAQSGDGQSQREATEAVQTEAVADRSAATEQAVPQAEPEPMRQDNPGVEQTLAPDTAQPGPAQVSSPEAAPNPAPTRTEATAASTPSEAPARREQKLGKRARILLIGGAVFVIALCALIPLSIHNAKQRRYNEGVTLLEQRDYEGASEIFGELYFDRGGFDDSDELYDYCNNMIAYESAEEQLQQGQYGHALERFSDLGDFLDAAEKSKLCAQEIAYADAQALVETGDLTAASEAFAALGDFRDAQEQAQRYGGKARYDEATALLDHGDYAGAQALFEALALDGYEDSAEKAEYCVNKIAYDVAEALYGEQAYFDAYQAFSKLGAFEDAAKRMKACVQTFPSTGELYHNSSYAGRACSLTIRPPTGDGSRNYIKVYAQNGDLVSRVAINKGDRAKIWLPAGSYQIKNAYSTGNWYGETDLFGDAGRYNVLKTGVGGSEFFAFQSNYEYTLSLRTSQTGGDTVKTETENREDF